MQCLSLLRSHTHPIKMVMSFVICAYIGDWGVVIYCKCSTLERVEKEKPIDKRCCSARMNQQPPPIQDKVVQAVLGMYQKHILFLCPGIFQPASLPQNFPPLNFPFLPPSPPSSPTTSSLLPPSPHFLLTPSPEFGRKQEERFIPNAEARKTREEREAPFFLFIFFSLWFFFLCVFLSFFLLEKKKIPKRKHLKRKGKNRRLEAGAKTER